MPLVILSGERTNYRGLRNILLSRGLRGVLDRFFPDYEPVIGSYKGSVEQSFAVPITDEDEYEHLRHIAIEYKQESILLVEDDMHATLIMLKDGEAIELGQFQAVSIGVPPPGDAWTLMNGIYFQAR